MAKKTLMANKQAATATTEETSSSLLFPSPATSSPCMTCNKEAAKYRCPACNTYSCSVACVKAHKAAVGCTGKRKRTDFVPLAEFDDERLLSGP